jgi:deazaflavin-dependent oxidoreductase (nitroreductase family)
MRVPRAVARFNSRITNPLAVALGGWAPLQGTLEHVGRKSGKRYRTPLNVFETDDGYVILVGYGLESHWVQNVLAGGPATIHKHGRTVPVANPRLVSKAEAAPLVTAARFFYRIHPYNEAALVVTAG